jgi:hypothetical protein
MGSTTSRLPFQVREQTSGRSGVTSYVVVRNPGGRRVSTEPSPVREIAEAQARDLNVGSLVLDHAEDPRPYDERRAEAGRVYDLMVTHDVTAESARAIVRKTPARVAQLFATLAASDEPF